MADEIKNYKLKDPVEFGGKTYGEINFREPLGKDLRRLAVESIERGDFDMMLTFGQQLCDCPPEVIDKLKSPDAFEVMRLVTELVKN